jgi:hypothetical protein
MAKIAKIQSKPIFCAKDHHVTISWGFFWTKTENFLLFTQAGSSQILYFLCQKYVPPPSSPKIIKFTRISRTVWNFATKIEISQNTKNFHPCNLKRIAYIELKLL